MNREPPPTVSLVWCPECGRDDRYNDLKARPGRHFANGVKCPGTPTTVQYQPIEGWSNVPRP